jgi:tetratricopeptide (TPR) repeat protein
MLMAASQCALGESELDLGHADTAVARVAAGRAALLSVANADPGILEDCAEAEAAVADAQGNPRGATQIAEKALALLERLGETHDVRYPGLLGRISDFYKEAGDTHKGFEYGERSLAAYENNGLGDTDQSMTAMHNMASSLSGVGEAKAACAREQQVVSRLQATGRTIITAIAVFHGSCFLKGGDAATALSWFDKGLKTAQDGNDASLQMHARVYRARALIELRRFDEAGTELDRVGALAAQNIAMGGVAAGRGQIVRAQLLLAQGRAEDAQRILNPMLPALREPNGRQRTLLPLALTGSVKIAMAQKRYPEAIELANELLKEQVRRARNPAMSADAGEASLLLAQAKQAIGDQNGMHEAARQAVISLTAGLGADNARTRDAINLQ